MKSKYKINSEIFLSLLRFKVYFLDFNTEVCFHFYKKMSNCKSWRILFSKIVQIIFHLSSTEQQKWSIYSFQNTLATATPNNYFKIYENWNNLLWWDNTMQKLVQKHPKWISKFQEYKTYLEPINCTTA